MKRLFIVGLILLNIGLYAEEKAEVPQLPMQDSLNELKLALQKLKSSEPSDYLKEIAEIRLKTAQYIEQGKQVCSGQFSAMVFGVDGSRKRRKRLTRKEREMCYLKLKTVQKEYYQTAFEAQKKYFKFLHQKNMQDLEHQHDATLEELDRTYKRLR